MSCTGRWRRQQQQQQQQQQEVVVRNDGEEDGFDEYELRNIRGYVRGNDCIEVNCGCSSSRFGDCVGKLRVYANGQFLITCLHVPDCAAVNVTPDYFERHAGKEGAKKWKSNIWIQVGNEKIPLWKSPLRKYYKFAANMANWMSVSDRKRKFHRDEFICCTKCNTERRFQLRNREQIKLYHDALQNNKWTCSDWPYQRIACEDPVERESRKNLRGCPREANCKGCTSCVCFGCLKCRFLDCACRSCVDFMLNVEPLT